MFCKECTRRGYKTYKDIICGNDKYIVDMMLKVKDANYITDFRDVDGNSLLEVAFQYGCVKSIESIMNTGLNLALRGHKTYAYVEIIRADNENVVDMLLKCKENTDDIIEIRDDDGNSLLEIAFQYGCIDSITSLMNSGFKFLLRGNKSYAYADIIRSNDKKIVNLLLKFKDTNDIIKFRDADGYSLLEIAFIHRCVESIEAMQLFGLQCSMNYERLISHNDRRLVDLLMQFTKYPALSFRDEQGNTLLHIAAQNGWTHSVESMVYNEVRRDIKNINNKLPIDFAVETGNQSVINLLSKKIDVRKIVKEYDDSRNKLAHLKYLVRDDRKDDLNILLLKRDLVSEHELTLLFAAAHYNNIYFFEFFIQYGCNVVVTGTYGDTVLYAAGCNDSKDVVKIITEKYPQILDVRNKRGETAYQKISDRITKNKEN